MPRPLIPALLDEFQIQNMKNFFPDFELEPFAGFRTEASNISVYEDDSNYYVEANMPGLQKKDIHVNMEKGTLWIDGKTAKEEENKKLKYHMKASSCFSYRVPVPGRIDSSLKPKASYENGVLKIKMEKAHSEKADRTNIEIE